ncbi:hypothetical protein F7X37_00259 [Candidatus Ecksteinia adelgidicola]|nr:hypothetical protein F7X37_00259 [Candidatus Ecksteinia adelgidicola]
MLQTITSCTVRSYRTLSPLLKNNILLKIIIISGLLSVALVVDFHLPGVTWHFALWSPDFPLLNFYYKQIKTLAATV